MGCDSVDKCMAIGLAHQNSACDPTIMLDRLSSLIIAATLVFMALILALVSGASWASAIVLSFAGLAGAALVYTASPSAIREPSIAYGESLNRSASASLLLHHDFIRWADQETDPVIGVQNNVVALANDAAVALLGRHIVGADIRTAIRHPAAAELFDKSQVGRISDGPVSLHDYPRAGHRWEIRLAQLSDRDAIIFLSDRSLIDAADRMRSDFVANASHELRTPLAAILGYVETLQDMIGDDALMEQRFLGIIDREAQRMQRLILDLLSISRVEADRFRRPTKSLDFAQLIQDTLAAIEDSAEARPEDIVATISAEPVMILGDEIQLTQLVHNVIVNAMKYGRAGAPIRVNLTSQKDRTTFSVEDEGDGIAPEHLPRLTERFYRVDDARSRSVGGTGLGLAIVKHISERHQGQLIIDSELGKGTIITLTLPLASEATGTSA
jgi:two-component system phosphate regulon sensor histidine kinase PhoR